MTRRNAPIHLLVATLLLSLLVPSTTAVAADPEVVIETAASFREDAPRLGTSEVTSGAHLLERCSVMTCGSATRTGPAGRPVVVPDPRVGDLRSDPSADILPVSYVPPAADRTIRDIAYGNDPAQQLDLHLPTNANAPVILFLHSGGWVGGDKRNVPDMVLRFVERGYAVASVGYRLAPAHRFPAPVHDVKNAILWLKAYGAEGGRLDGDRIVLYGTSAGGHLAAFVAATPGSFEPDHIAPGHAAFDTGVAGVVSAVGPTELVSFYAQRDPWAIAFTGAFLGCETCGDEALSTASPVSHLHADLPPAYWAYGSDDTLVRADTQGEVIAAAWAEHAGPNSSWIDVVDGAGHNLDESLINQRFVESFVDYAASRGGPSRVMALS